MRAVEPPPSNLAFPLAQLPRRLAAMGYDGLLLTGVLFVAAALALGLTVILIGSAVFETHNPLPGNPFFRSYLLLVCFFFYGGFWVHGGQTLGMRAWRVRVQRRDGRGIGWWQALLRFLIASLWLAPVAYLHQVFKLGIGFSLGAGFACLLLLLVLRLPDRFSETELVLLPKGGNG
ncbi:MAG: RDD family protein [Candidatus Competibacteraceae bacterium]|nr:MAG: RDD family protein [Candidatus Competibacteraceae bacterium]